MKNHYTFSNHTLRHKSNNHITNQHKIPFRTLLKHRNGNLTTAQTYQNKYIHRQSSPSKAITQSHIAQTQHPHPSTPTINIKQYTKQMKLKTQNQVIRPFEDIKKDTQIDDDKLSTRSTKSQFLSPQIIKSSLLKQQKQTLSIEEIDKRIEELLTASFLKFKKQKTHIGLSKWLQINLQTNLQKELDYLIEALNTIKLQTQNPQDEKLQTINRKIQVLQNMIASQSTQSQILKSQYFGWTNQRSTTTSFLNKKLLENTKKLNPDTKQFSKQLQSSEKRLSSSLLDFTSTSEISYKKPNKDFYFQHKQPKQQYVHNHQPLCRSSYSAQYLNYGSVPTYSYKPDQTKQFPDASTAVKASVYQQEYKQKLGLTNNINFKQLDCYRDKFKNPNISFIISSKKQYYEKANKKLNKKAYQNSNKNTQKQTTHQKDKAATPEKTYSFIHLSTCGSFYKTQHQQQFLWHNNLQNNHDLLKSQIKDKQLSQLKNHYKTIALRS